MRGPPRQGAETHARHPAAIHEHCTCAACRPARRLLAVHSLSRDDDAPRLDASRTCRTSSVQRAALGQLAVPSAVSTHITISPGLYSAAAFNASTGTTCNAAANSAGKTRPAGFVTSACGGKLPGRP